MWYKAAMPKGEGFGGQSMAGRLRRVMVCAPDAGSWQAGSQEWRNMGYLRAPDFARAQAQHGALRNALQAAGAEVIALDGRGLSMDAVYAHDASFMTDYGAICLNMGKRCRKEEPGRHRAFYQAMGIPVLGEIRKPGTAEAGDMVWLDERTLLVGRGYRTNAAGIEQLRSLLAPKVEAIAAPLPHGAGPGSCLHLMSLMSVLDKRTLLVDLPWLAAETVQLLCERGFRLVEIDAAERDTLACNVLALGEGRLLAFEENRRTNERLRAAGFQVHTFAGGELGVNGGGGPTCLTRPIEREQSA